MRAEAIQVFGRRPIVAAAVANWNDLIVDGSGWCGHWVAWLLIVRDWASGRIKTPTRRITASVGTWWWQIWEKDVGCESWLLSFCQDWLVRVLSLFYMLRHVRDERQILENFEERKNKDKKWFGINLSFSNIHRRNCLRILSTTLNIRNLRADVASSRQHQK